MRNKLLFVLFILTAFSVAADIKLISINGFVQVNEKEDAEWITPSVGFALQPGYIIYTGFNSSAKIKTNDAEIDVKPLSQINISSLIATAKKVSTDIYLKYGTVKASVNTNKETETTFKVRSANSTASVRGTVFEFGEDNLFVENGTVHLLSNDGFGTLVQEDESAEAGFFNFAVTPYEKMLLNYYVNTSPIGLSDSEKSGLDISDSKIRGKARIIIRIKVI